MTQKSDNFRDLDSNEPGATGLAADKKALQLFSSYPMAEHLVSIVQSCDDAIVSKTLNGVITSWNPGAEAIFGYARTEAIGQPMTLIFPPDRINEESFILERICAGERVEHFETIRIRKDGAQIHVSVTISPIFNAAGEIIGASKIARDITKQKAERERLLLAAAVFTHASEAIIITSDLGKIVDVNAAFSRITGYSHAEVIGRGPDMFKSSRQGPEAYMRLQAELGRQGYCQGEVWSRRKGGETFAGLLTVSAVHDDFGRIQNYVAIFADITMLKEHQELLDRLAHHDPLTGLPNRLLLADRIGQAVANSRRTQRGFAVLYLDLDNFKTVNDLYGHDVGDSLLIALTQRMKSHVRDGDTLARIGGDEFVVIFVDMSSTADCEQIVERILRACRERVHLGEIQLQLSCSIGYTVFPEDDAEPDQLLRHADQAMYEAKRRGRNCGYRFDSVQDAVSRGREEHLGRLTRALLRGEFCLYYQPKVNLRTGTVVGAEALIRWNHPERGVLAPAAFLPPIAGTALSYSIDEWVIENAIKQAAQWESEGLDISVSVNISGAGLQRPGFPIRLARMLAEHTDLAPHRLELEIIESTAIENIGLVTEIMQNCQQIGVRFAVDDFGTGYSSLTYLRRLPAESLKIDQSFVRDMLHDRDDLAIVESVISLAKAFNREVIAEGVETVEHGVQLLSMGCELAQGYAIARPMRAQDIPAWVMSWKSNGSWPPSASRDVFEFKVTRKNVALDP